MVHIKNMNHVLKHGITHAKSANANPDYVPIGDSSLIEKRSAIPLQYNKKLGDYTLLLWATYANAICHTKWFQRNKNYTT